MTLCVNEVAKILGISRQGVSIAILKGKLKAKKNGWEWRIEENDLIPYLLNKHKRSETYCKKYPLNPGEIILSDAAKKYKVSKDYLYKAVYAEHIPGFMRGRRWILKEQHVIDFKKSKKIKRRRKDGF